MLVVLEIITQQIRPASLSSCGSNVSKDRRWFHKLSEIMPLSFLFKVAMADQTARQDLADWMSCLKDSLFCLSP